MDLFIDANRGGRPQRQNLLNPNFNAVGVYTCEHGNMGQRFTVIDYAGKMEMKSHATETIAALKEKYHPAVEPEEPEPERCSILPEDVVTPNDCGLFEKFNEVRTNPSSMVAQLDELLADDALQGENRYLVFKARRKLHKQRAGLKAFAFNDSLFLAAADHCKDGTDNGIVGDVGSDGSFPSERVQKYAKAMGVEEQVDASAVLDSVDKAAQYGIVNFDLEQLFNPHTKFGALATCAHKTAGGFYVGLTAESVVPSKATLQKIDDIIK